MIDHFFHYLFTTTELPSPTTEPHLQLGGFVDIEVEREKPREEEVREEEGQLVHVEEEGPERDDDGEAERRRIGVVDPDRMLTAEERRRTEQEEAILNGRKEAEEVDDDEEAEDDELGTTEPEVSPPEQIRQFGGTTALALPAERGQRLDALNLEVQIRPQSLNGVILYAAGSGNHRRPKQKPPFMHSLELANGTVKYTFALAGETFEVLQSSETVPLDEWSTIRVNNDGKGKASLQVGAARPSELFYTIRRRPSPQTFNVPSRIFLGGPDPARAKHMPKTSLNFVGSIGRLTMNGRKVEVLGAEERAETASGQPPSVGAVGARQQQQQQQTSLYQSENQCSREPCRNGGRCRLTQWGGFECHCMHGYAGHLCQLPSTDGVCPGGQRWCHRGICSLGGARNGANQCLCPPGWEGQRCESELKLDSRPKGIRFDGKQSFLALPLGVGVEEGSAEQAPRVYSIELQLSPDPDRRGNEVQQLVGVMIGAQGRAISALGMQGEKFWAIQQEGDDQPATKRLLTKRIKHKKTHRLRLEPGDGPGEMRVLVEGRPKGVLKGEAGPDGMLLLGALPPRGIALPEAMSDTLLEGVHPFAGCVEQLLLNGRELDMEQLMKDGYTGGQLDTCERAEAVQQPTEALQPTETIQPTEAVLSTETVHSTEPMTTEEESTFAPPTTTTTIIEPTTPPEPTTPVAIISVSEDPSLAGHRQREGPLVGPVGVLEAKEWSRMPPTTLFPDSISTELPPDIRSTAATTTVTTAPMTPDPTTMVPAPPRPPVFRHRTQRPPMPIAPPTFVTEPDPAELEGPFVGLCNAMPCGAHGSCEEVNQTHVLCACRDYYVGQRCEEFRPIEYAAKFDGNAFVVFSSDEFPHLNSERQEMVEFKLRTRAKYGLIIWQGQQPDPEEPTPAAGGDALIAAGEDYLSIGLVDGYLSFAYELGGGAAQILSENPVDDGKTHRVRAVRKGRDGWLFVDDDPPVSGRSSGILAMLNVEGHLFVGGVPDLHQMTAGLHTQNFYGCLAELSLNGHRMDLMGNAIDGQNVRPCRQWQPNRMRRRRKWMQLLRKQRKAAQQRRRALLEA